MLQGKVTETARPNMCRALQNFEKRLIETGYDSDSISDITNNWLIEKLIKEWSLDFLVTHSGYEWIMERFEIDKISLLDEKKIVGKKKIHRNEI